MKIIINKKDIYKKQYIYVIEQEHKIKLKTNNYNKIKAWQKTMNYLKIKDYKIYRIEVIKLYDYNTNLY